MTERSLLTEGSEWSPVQEIVRLTFKSLHDIIKSQGKAIQNLEQALADKVGGARLELVDGGHMLPVTQPDACVALIEQMAQASGLAGGGAQQAAGAH